MNLTFFFIGFAVYFSFLQLVLYFALSIGLFYVSEFFFANFLKLNVRSFLFASVGGLFCWSFCFQNGSHALKFIWLVRFDEALPALPNEFFTALVSSFVLSATFRS